MSKRRLLLKYTTVSVVFALGIAFVVTFGGASILKTYISQGIGTCRSEPVLCKVPTEFIRGPRADSGFRAELIEMTFPMTTISIPKGFNAAEELVKKLYYKKHKRFFRDEHIYLLYQKPGFFLSLYPSIKKKGVADNYEFMRRVMNAHLNEIKDFTDAFFVVMKGILTPDLGDQSGVKMASWTMGPLKGFISYNMSGSQNFFDVTAFTPKNDFFKIYIKDPRGRLDLEKVFTIISTVKRTPPGQGPSSI